MGMLNKTVLLIAMQEIPQIAVHIYVCAIPISMPPLLIISGAHQQLLMALQEHTLETFTTQQVLLIMTRYVHLVVLVLVAIWIAAVSTQAGFLSVLAIKVAAVITSSILLLNAAMVLHPSVIFNQSAHVREIVR